MDRTLAVPGTEESDRGDEAEPDIHDAGTFAHLYEAHLTGLYRYFLAHTGNPAEAADLTQQVFVQALGAWPRYHGGADGVCPWLFRIARNLLIDTRRRRRPTVSWEDVPPQSHPAATDDTEAAAFRRDEERALATALAGLPADKRELLIMRFAGGLTVREIAHALDRRDEAVRSEIRRLLHVLKEKMAHE